MIVFDLKCGDGHVFEAWFRDGAAYEAQASAGEIVCPACGDTAIAKAPMAPNVARGAPAPEAASKGEAMGILRAVREHVEKTFDKVGERVPEEARKIHFGEVAKRNIYGQATGEEARKLTEDGVEFGPLPWVPRHHS